MTETIRLGTVAGVRVGLHWSVLGIVVLLLVSFAGGLPAQFPDHSPAAYILAALVATALFVLSLLAHEIGHAVVAVRNGIEVDGITLWLLGGVARLRGEATNPGMDFRIAAVGPALSLVLGAAFTVASWVLSGAQAPNWSPEWSATSAPSTSCSRPSTSSQPRHWTAAASCERRCGPGEETKPRPRSGLPAPAGYSDSSSWRWEFSECSPAPAAACGGS
jgi:hypothetical protein